MKNSNRDYVIDILKGVLIIAMIIGHSAISEPVKRVIYSVHMPAFVIMSGLFYKKREFKTAVLHLSKAFLVPYAVFCCIDLFCKLVTGQANSAEELIRKYFFCVSFSGDFFISAESVGPVYFILLLFGTRLLYIFVDHIFKPEVCKIIACVIISLFGLMLGRNGYWLPWSFDCAMFALIFYLIGILLSRYQILQKTKQNIFLFFLFVVVWGYTIRHSYFEIALRIYNPYILVIIGAVSGTIVLYVLCDVICRFLSHKITNILYEIGVSTIYILVVHTIYRSFIAEYITYYLGDNQKINLIINITIQISIALLCKWLLRRINANNSSR